MNIPRMNGGPVPLGSVPIIRSGPARPPTVDVEAGFGDNGPMIRLRDPATGTTIEMEMILALRVNSLIDQAVADLIQAMQRQIASESESGIIVPGSGV